ncbi:MAG: aldo/keto reductase [Candidatus Bathyarchaeia archaeon]
MQHRKLGNTGLEVSVIGLGAAMLGSSNVEYAGKVAKRALELGINYYDTAHSYWSSEIILGQVLKERRKEVYISSKTEATTKDEAWKHIKESLERLQTDHLDNYHLHGLRDEKDLETRLGPGGALEALIEAREQGLISHIGCTSHRSKTLLSALKRFNFEIILVPMNIVEREPLQELIPICKQKGVGITIMKPVATGLLPTEIALKWLLNQPVDTVVPGATTIEEVEADVQVGQLADIALKPEEQRRVDQIAKILDNVRCRLCAECEPCPKQIPIAATLGTDVMYDHYRNMGPRAFQEFPWSTERVKEELEKRRVRISLIKSCNQCGECERRCPYKLPIIGMLHDMIEPMEDMLRIWQELLARHEPQLP